MILHRNENYLTFIKNNNRESTLFGIYKLL